MSRQKEILGQRFWPTLCDARERKVLSINIYTFRQTNTQHNQKLRFNEIIRQRVRVRVSKYILSFILDKDVFFEVKMPFRYESRSSPVENTIINQHCCVTKGSETVYLQRTRAEAQQPSSGLRNLWEMGT